jgi:transcriptional antiterminator RfaH
LIRVLFFLSSHSAFFPLHLSGQSVSWRRFWFTLPAEMLKRPRFVASPLGSLMLVSNGRMKTEETRLSGVRTGIAEGDDFCDAAWYCVRSQPKHEHIAAANLRRHLDVEVFSPIIRYRRPTRRGPVWVNEPLFPSYLFAYFDRNTLFDSVRHTYGVSSIVHFGNYCPIIPGRIISELRESVGGDEPRVLEEALTPGDEIEVSGGPFDGLRAIVTRLFPARQRIAVLLEFLGRQTLIELDRAAVITEKAWCAIRLGGDLCATPAVALA